MAPKIAASHPSIRNPGSSAAQIFNTAPFTPKVKSPSVTILIGKVKSIRIGQMTTLAIPMAADASKAAKKPLTLKPFIIFDVNKSANAESAQ